MVPVHKYVMSISKLLFSEHVIVRYRTVPLYMRPYYAHYALGRIDTGYFLNVESIVLISSV